METTERTPAIPSPLPGRNYDGWIMLGYAVCAVVALATIYLAFGGPGSTEADLAIATAMP
jgi:hypothetical protein